ncbi:Crp/Fnr family transcriptional regulator [Synechococcus elongatus IITB7]|uniref:Crp/Fnr family transcriptional regulator n=1 Tax=Synechococcus elongatus TaxID=32046 RepID=UPI0030D57782
MSNKQTATLLPPTTAAIATSPRLLIGRRGMVPTGADTIWKIQSGLVRSSTWGEEGDMISLGLWGPGDLIGRPLSCLDPYELECLTAVEVVAVTDPALESHESLVRSLRYTEQLLSITRLRRAEAKLANLLSWIGERFGHPSANGWEIDLRRIPLTHQVIAELSGSTRVTTTRLLGEFRQAGRISRRDRALIVRYPEALYPPARLSA